MATKEQGDLILRDSKSQEYADILTKEYGVSFTKEDVYPIFDASPEGRDVLVQGLVSSKTAMSTGEMVATGAAIAAEAGIGMAGQVMSGGNPVVGAGAGGVGNLVGQNIRVVAGLQDEVYKGEVMGSVAAGAIPGGPIVKGASAAKTFFKSALASETGYVLSENIRRLLDDGRFSTGEELLNPAAQVFVLGGASLDFASTAYAKRAGQLDMLREAGIDTKKMPQSLLTNAAWAAKTDAISAATNLESRQRFAEAFDGLSGGDVREWLVPESNNAEVAAVIRPYIGKIDTLQARLNTANEQSNLLIDQAAKAAADANISSDQKLTIYSAASESVLNKAVTQLEALQYASTSAGPASNPAMLAKLWSSTVSGLFEKQKALSRATYKAVGLNSTDLLVNADQLADAVEQELSGFGKLKAVDDVVAYIRGSAQMDEVIDAKGKTTKVARSGNNLDNGQLLEMRRSLNSQLNPDSSRPNVSDAILNKAYDVIRRERLVGVGASNLGVDVKKLVSADSAYARFMTLRDDKFASRLLDTKVSDETISGIAAQAASGKVQDMENALAFAREIGPEAEASFGSVMQQALKETLINDAFSKSGLNNKSFNQNLADSVLKTNTYLQQVDGLKNFNLGFGDAQAIRRWNYAFNELDIKKLNKKDLEKLFADPLFQKALSEGNGKVASSRAAKELYKKLVLTERRKLESGVEQTYAEKKKAASRLDELFKEANQTREEVSAAYEAAQNDPFTVYLSGKGNFGVTAKIGQGASDFAESLFSEGPAEAKRFMTALKKSNPAGHALVLRELRTNAFSVVVEDLAAKGFYSNDYTRISTEFNNPNPNAKIKVLKELSTPAEWSAFTKTAKVADILTKHAERGKMANTDSVFADIFGVLVGGSAMLKGGFSAGTLARNLGQKAIDVSQRIGFGAWSQILGDRTTSNALAKIISGAATFKQVYNPVQIYNMQKNNPEIYELFYSLSPDEEEIAYLKQKRESEAADAIYRQTSMGFRETLRNQ